MFWFEEFYSDCRLLIAFLPLDLGLEPVINRRNLSRLECPKMEVKKNKKPTWQNTYSCLGHEHGTSNEASLLPKAFQNITNLNENLELTLCKFKKKRKKKNKRMQGKKEKEWKDESSFIQ